MLLFNVNTEKGEQRNSAEATFQKAVLSNKGIQLNLNKKLRIVCKMEDAKFVSFFSQIPFPCELFC